MYKPKGKNDFLRTPGFPGGDAALKKFVTKNLRYPEEAKAAKIEGKVTVGYQVNDNGVVLNAHILKGLGHGCDEEALRIIKLMRFEKVKNRKVRVKVTRRTSINFRLPSLKINYTVSSTKKPAATKAKTDSGDKKSGYSYTIDLP